jgi:hypothetical protein
MDPGEAARRVGRWGWEGIGAGSAVGELYGREGIRWREAGGQGWQVRIGGTRDGFPVLWRGVGVRVAQEADDLRHSGLEETTMGAVGGAVGGEGVAVAEEGFQ